MLCELGTRWLLRGGKVRNLVYHTDVSIASFTDLLMYV